MGAGCRNAEKRVGSVRDFGFLWVCVGVCFVWEGWQVVWHESEEIAGLAVLSGGDSGENVGV